MMQTKHAMKFKYLASIFFFKLKLHTFLLVSKRHQDFGQDLEL